MTWKGEYNVSGTVHSENMNDWFLLMRDVLETEIGMIGHFTGEVSIAGASNVAKMTSTGRETFNFRALAPGERADWLQFGERLETALMEANLPYSLVVHQEILPPT